MRKLELAPAITLDGRRARSCTRVGQVDAGHMALATVLEDSGVELRSYYTGRDELRQSHVVHVLLARGVAELESRELRYSEVPVMYARRRCLEDHLWRLADFLRELDYGDVAIDGVDEALLLAVEA